MIVRRALYQNLLKCYFNDFFTLLAVSYYLMAWYRRIFPNNPFQTREQDSDVVIKVDGKQLFVHSWILSNFSPVFQRMLNESFREHDDDVMKTITIVTHKVGHMIEFLKFFYPELSQVVNSKYIKFVGRLL